MTLSHESDSHATPTRAVGVSGYKAGCRCSGCRAGYSEYMRTSRQAWRKANGPAAQRERERHAQRLRERRAAGERV